VEADALFTATLDDLEQRVIPGRPEYDVLMAAALIRKLLLDEHPLAHVVNRPPERRLKLRFRTNVAPAVWEVLPDTPKPVFWSIQDGLDPETAVMRRHAPSDLSLDDFLRVRVMLIEGHEINVHELVDHAAHVSGAVHAGPPGSEKERALQDVTRQIQVGGYDPAVRSLLAIGRITLRALAPLRAVVEDS
jgi:hypothetical protein